MASAITELVNQVSYASSTEERLHESGDRFAQLAPLVPPQSGTGAHFSTNLAPHLCTVVFFVVVGFSSLSTLAFFVVSVGGHSVAPHQTST